MTNKTPTPLTLVDRIDLLTQRYTETIRRIADLEDKVDQLSTLCAVQAQLLQMASNNLNHRLEIVEEIVEIDDAICDEDLCPDCGLVSEHDYAVPDMWPPTKKMQGN